MIICKLHTIITNMSLKRKLEGEVEIRAAGGDAFHDIYTSKPHHVSHAAPHFVQTCDLHEGEYGKLGSIITWKYTTGDGKSAVAKVIFEEVDEEKKLVKQKCIGGDLLNEYKSINAICQVIPKDSESSTVKWVLEYEKLHPGIPEPSELLDSFLALAKDIDDHHHRDK